MKVTTEWTEDAQAILSIEAEPEEMEESLGLAYRKLAKKVNIPGFRKGKVPRDLLERYVGRGALMEEAVEHLVPNLYGQAVERTKIEPIADPNLEMLGFEPITFKATVPLKPSVELGNYRQIRVGREDLEVTEEQTEELMERIRERHGTYYEPVDRPVSFGDMAVIDLEERIEDRPTRSFQAQEYPVMEDSPFPLPGFAEQINGMARDEEKTFTLPFPEDSENEELRGKEVTFYIKVLEVKEKHVQEWSDELVKAVSSDLDSLEALRERASEDLRKEAEAAYEEQVINTVSEAAQVEFPPILVERELDDFLRQQAARFGGGEQGAETYLKAMGKTEEELRADLRPSATQRVRRSLVLGKMSAEEDLQVDAADIDAEIEAIATQGTEVNTELQTSLQSPQGRRLVEQTLVFRKARERLVEIASGPPEAESSSGSEDQEASEQSLSEEEKDSVPPPEGDASENTDNG